jgi:hypothetical protein
MMGLGWECGLFNGLVARFVAVESYELADPVVCRAAIKGWHEG